MKVLLISANTVRIPYHIYPLGLDYVAAAIAGRHEVAIADMNDGGIDTVIAAARAFGPDVVGISIRNIDNTDAGGARGFIGAYRELVAAIRGMTKAPIVLGGSGFTIFPRRLMDELAADYGIIGEGERLRDLLEALESGREPKAVPGVITPGGDESPPPPFDRPPPRINAAFPHADFYTARGGMLNLQTKRGCSYRCIYCTYPRVEGSRIREIPPDEVAGTALALQKAGAKYLFMTDSVLNVGHEHSLAIARAFIQRGISVPWGAFFAPTRPPDGYYRTLRDAGLAHVEFGTESLSNAMLASYRKPFTVDDAIAAHEAAVEAGAHVAHYLLLGGPGENRETLAETLRNAARLEKTVVFFFCGVRIYPHTEIYDIALREGQITETDDLLEPVFYRSPAIGTDEILYTVGEGARGRENWVIGAGGNHTARLVSRMHRQGHVGPLWEYLVR